MFDPTEMTTYVQCSDFFHVGPALFQIMTIHNLLGAIDALDRKLARQPFLGCSIPGFLAVAYRAVNVHFHLFGIAAM